MPAPRSYTPRQTGSIEALPLGAPLRCIWSREIAFVYQAFTPGGKNFLTLCVIITSENGKKRMREKRRGVPRVCWFRYNNFMARDWKRGGRLIMSWRMLSFSSIPVLKRCYVVQLLLGHKKGTLCFLFFSLLCQEHPWRKWETKNWKEYVRMTIKMKYALSPVLQLHRARCCLSWECGKARLLYFMLISQKIFLCVTKVKTSVFS